jgi:thioester reductase-like protein
VRRGVRCSSVAAIGFDAATWELWPPLAAGATLVQASAEVASNAEKLVHWWLNEALDVSFLPTPMAEFVLSRGMMNPRVRKLLIGGDRLRLHPTLHGVELINNYGPTETTVVATSGRIHDSDDILHIGRPMANARIYVLDERVRPVPMGVCGELYISGEGVARGYLNRPELTVDRFLPDPFATEPGQRMYRSGDLARWRSDGTIEYLGRHDHQIKIRGYRIELGEIDAQLLHHAQVHDAVVDAKRGPDDATHLVAYYVPREGCRIEGEELRSYLKALLPDYMIPSAFVPMASLPLTAHGKLNRSALPAPSLDSGPYEPPRGQREERLAAIWKELLKVAKVSRNDHFFELGGHSILAVNALFRINRAFECTLNVTDLYQHPVLSDQAARIGDCSACDERIELAREAILDERIFGMSELPRTCPQAILLTGATGFVGRFLLAQLLRESDATIYCLVRGQPSPQGLSRLQDTLKQWDLWRAEFEERIVAISGDLRLPGLGMSPADQQLLAERIDHIYHAGASMNHLESYAMAKSANVSAAVELLQLATRGRPKLLNHLSSLSVFRSNGSLARTVEETTSIDHERHTSSKGYVASKWVSEKIILLAHERRIPCNVFRVGLVWADTEQGRYDELQHGDRLFRSCLQSGFGIENYRPKMAPTPVDYVATAIVALAARHTAGGGLFHIASPEPRWSGLFERCNAVTGTELKLLPYYDWICQIKRLHHIGGSLPIVPLIEFAFSMTEEQFADHVREDPTAGLRFDCAHTHAELERAGIRMPVVDDDLLRRFVQGLRGSDLPISVRPAG